MRTKIEYISKKCKVILILLLLCINNVHFSQKLPTVTSRASNSLKSGNWYKIAIPQTSVYKIDFDFMTKNLKVPSNELRFSTFGIFGYSGGALEEDNTAPYFEDLPENTIQIQDANNNDIWDSEDFVLFFGKGPFAWKSENNQMKHTSAYYADFQHFFITTSNGSKKTISTQRLSGSPQRIFSTFNDFGVFEKDSVNPNKTGRTWFCPAMTNIRNEYQFSVPMQGLSAGSNCIGRFSYYTKMTSAVLSVFINDVFAYSKSISNSPNLQTDTFTFIASDKSINVKFRLNTSSPESFYLDYFSVNATTPLRFQSEPLYFLTTEELGNNKLLEFKIDLGGKNISVWNVSDIKNIRSILDGNSILFNNNTLQEFIAFENNNVKTPIAISKIKNQDIKGFSAAYHTIIAPQNWIEVAQKIAKFHEEERGITTNVIDIDAIYNEFSSGNKDIMAIRRMMKYFKSKGNPKTLLLFGDASIHQKDQEDFIPTYETISPENYSTSYCTDDFYGLLDASESTLDKGGDLDIGIGRIPANSLTEANYAFEKIKAYKSAASYGDWRNYTSLVADDVDNNFDVDFLFQSESIANRLKDSVKTQVEKIYLDAFRQENFSGGQRYEEADKLIKDRMIFGGLLMTYIGHGGQNNWAQERVLSIKDIETYKNIHNLPFVTTATCGFAPYDRPNNEKSAGEKFLMQRDGGAIAMMTTSREVYITDQERFMNTFIEEFFKKDGPNNEYRDFGAIARNTKNRNNLNVNSQKIVLLGDPALIINKPKFNVITTSISNGTDDTLKSLSKITLKGAVTNLNNNIIQDFNGVCDVTIFDKKNKALTNDNDGTLNKKDTFEIQNNRIFRGKATVINGQFSITFIVPKNINYAIGKGRIVYYASDVRQKPYRDASGFDDNVIIGGSNFNAEKDNKPPIVNVFMNDEKFGFGGTTDANPKLLTKLKDENGINTSNTGVGHDIEAFLDENTKSPIVLNNYYQTEVDDYTQGRVLFPFYNLAEGKHTLRVRAWDVQNNMGEGYTEFYVYANEELVLNRLLNYPNPFTTNTYFEFEHNRPGDLLDVTVNVMTVSGKVVKSIHQKITTEGFRSSKQIQWNGLDNYGDRIGRGAYIYQLTIRDSKGKTASKYEKLVVLQ